MCFCSMGIESVVDEKNGEKSAGLRDAGCSACEMAVVWIQSQLRQNMTQERILEYVNQVSVLVANFFIFILDEVASVLNLNFKTIAAL